MSAFNSAILAWLVLSIDRTSRYVGLMALSLTVLTGCGTLNTSVAGATPSSISTMAASLPTPNIPTSTAISLRTLPTPGITPSIRPPYCGPGVAAGNAITYTSPAAQTWAASQVVVGIVTEQEARWQVVSGYAYIVTYSLLKVEARVRGLPFTSLFIATSGGSIDGCTQQSNTPTLARGERVLLFLVGEERRAPTTPSAIYVISGGEGGRQELAPATDSAGVLASLRQTLTQPPPSDLRPDIIVPLESAPMTP